MAEVVELEDAAKSNKRVALVIAVLALLLFFPGLGLWLPSLVR